MKKNSQHGFSLLEILIAFTILAMSLSIVLKIFSSGVLAAGVAEDYTIAVQIAEGLMAKTGVETKLQASHSAGIEEAKYAFEILVTPYSFNPEGVDSSALPTRLFKVKVTVSWDEENGNPRQLELVTLKLANKQL